MGYVTIRARCPVVEEEERERKEARRTKKKGGRDPEQGLCHCDEREKSEDAGDVGEGGSAI